jgi:hypothetical protein
MYRLIVSLYCFWRICAINVVYRARCHLASFAQICTIQAVEIEIPVPTERSTKAVATGGCQQRSGRLTDRSKPERKRNGTIIK